MIIFFKKINGFYSVNNGQISHGYDSNANLCYCSLNYLIYFGLFLVMIGGILFILLDMEYWLVFHGITF